MSGILAPEARGRKLEMKGALAPVCIFAPIVALFGLVALLSFAIPNNDVLAASQAALQRWTAGPQPPFALDSLSGESKRLADQKGRVVLVHFFATWCEPCREEISSLQRLTERVGSKASVLAVDVGEVDIRVKRFFEKLPVDFPVLLDRDKATAKSWGVDQLPTTFLLDGTLMPRFVIIGDFDWDRAEADKAIAELSGPKKQTALQAEMTKAENLGGRP